MIRDRGEKKGKKKKGRSKNGGVDVHGLEGALKTGGVGGLMGMLSAMRAGMGHADSHIKKGPHGEDMYDFRDLDDGLTTPKPIEITMPTMAPKPTLDPKLNFGSVAIPSATSAALPGQGGKLKGGQVSQRFSAAATGPNGQKLVVWGSKSEPAPQPLQSSPQQSQPQSPQPVAYGQPLQPAAFGQQLQPMAQAQPPQPVAYGQPLQQVAFGQPLQPMAQNLVQPLQFPMNMQPVPTAQISASLAAPTSGMYQGLAAISQKLDMLMGQAAVENGQGGNTASMAAKVDQLSQTFTSDEHKMEQQLDEQAKEIKELEQENVAMKKQLDEQGKMMKAMEQVSKSHPIAAAKEESKIKKVEVLAVKKQKIQKAHVKEDDSGKGQATKVEKAKTTQQLRGKASNVVGVASNSTRAQSSVASNSTRAQSSVPKAHTYASKPWDATFRVHLDGKTDGQEDSFTVRVHPEWAPEGAKRFQDIVEAGILDDARFFRVVPNFMVQFGIPGSPAEAAKWVRKRIADDEVKQSNARGTMTFAKSGPNSRTTQMFINYANNDFLDQQGFAPFAEVLGDGMDVVAKIQAKYREEPNQGKIQRLGNSYLAKHFPDLSFMSHVDSTSKKAASLIQHSLAPHVQQAVVEHVKKRASESLAQASTHSESHKQVQKTQDEDNEDEDDEEQD